MNQKKRLFNPANVINVKICIYIQKYKPIPHILIIVSAQEPSFTGKISRFGSSAIFNQNSDMCLRTDKYLKR